MLCEKNQLNSSSEPLLLLTLTSVVFPAPFSLLSKAWHLQVSFGAILATQRENSCVSGTFCFPLRHYSFAHPSGPRDISLPAKNTQLFCTLNAPKEL